MFVGVDGCRAGWFAIGLESESSWQVNVFPDVYSLWDHHRQAFLILIDIPIGLKTDGSAERRCDPIVRKLLGPRRSSVFPAPCRGAIYAGSYQEACDINQRLTGKRLSVENWNIIPKICEMDSLLSDDKSVEGRIREIHPEFCFWGLAGQPMRHAKKRTEGLAERTQLLQSIYPQTADIIKHTLSTYRRKDVARDDILDALAAALTGLMGKQNLTSIPQEPEFDERGLRMEMVYCPHTVVESL
jgi:predicted RNase H-like nuclease